MRTELALVDLVAERGSMPINLVTRLAGKYFWEQLEARLKEIPSSSVVFLSFTGVEIMDASFADEVFGTLASSRARQEITFSPVVLANANTTCVENLEMALKTRIDREPTELDRLRNCVLPMQRRDRTVLIGKFEGYIAESFELLVKHKVLTARTLADDRGLNLNAASTRLKTLADLGLARRSETRDAQGKQFVYESLQ